MASYSFLIATVAVWSVAMAAASAKPHILHVIVDDLGFGNTG
jgi:hypothetical protein